MEEYSKSEGCVLFLSRHCDCEPCEAGSKERLGEAKDPTVKFDVMRDQKLAKEWK